MWRPSDTNLKEIPYRNMKERIAAMNKLATSGNTTAGSALDSTGWAIPTMRWGHGYSKPASGIAAWCTTGQDALHAWYSGSCQGGMLRLVQYLSANGFIGTLASIINRVKPDLDLTMTGSGPEGGKTDWYMPLSEMCATDPTGLAACASPPTGPCTAECGQSTHYCFVDPAPSKTDTPPTVVSGMACKPFGS